MKRGSRDRYSKGFQVLLAVVIGLAIHSPAGAAEDEGFFGFKLAPEDRGVRITYIFEEEAADRGGLRVGDLILAVDDTSFAGPNEVPMTSEGFRFNDFSGMSLTRTPT